MTQTKPPHKRASAAGRIRAGLDAITDTCLGLAMYAPIAAAKLLPYHLRVPLVGRVTSRLVAPLAGYDDRIRENLAYVLPSIPEEEVKRLVRAVPDNAGRNMMELFSLKDFSERAKNSKVFGPGLDTIIEAKQNGQPIIFVTGHFGSFNAARIAMIEQGFEMGVFYRPLHNKWFNKRYTKAMGALSQPMFEQGRAGMKQTVKHLRSGGVLAILTDLNSGDGVPLTFFNKPALSPLATAELALKFNAPLVPVWGIRANNGLDFEILVEEPISPTNAEKMTQDVNDRLENQIRERMDQWLWIHRRWKGAQALQEQREKEDRTGASSD